jgi:hypothetical protein
MPKYLVAQSYNEIDHSIRWVSLKLDAEFIETLRECQDAINANPRLDNVEACIRNEVAYLDYPLTHFNFEHGWNILTLEEGMEDNTEYRYEYHRIKVDSWGDAYLYSEFKHSNADLHSVGIDPSELITAWMKETDNV